jgi:NAD(P)H-nitrite reductase large subunit
MKIVIIGAGGAGLSALETIRKFDKDSPITVISSEKCLPYSLCALPSLLEGELPHKHLPRVGKNYFKKNKVTLLQGSPVKSIRPKDKILALKNGKSIKYDKLLIATGSVPIIPRIEGISKAGVFSLSDLAGSQKILAYIKKRKAKRAIIIGAGFTGIEAAESLSAQGLKVIIVEMLPRVLARILDEDMTAPVDEALKGKEIEVKLKEEVVSINGTKSVSGVSLKSPMPDGRDARLVPRRDVGRNEVERARCSIPCDLVIVSIGVRPNLNLLEGSNIKTNRGIVVDEHMQTNIDGVYATGDVAESHDFISGKPSLSAIWPNAVEQGRVAALNMLNTTAAYEGNVSINSLNLDGLSITGMGQTSAEAKAEGVHGLEEIKYQNSQSTRKLILRNNRIIGFQCIGPFRHSGIIWTNIIKRADVSDIKHQLLKDNPRLQYVK